MELYTLLENISLTFIFEVRKVINLTKVLRESLDPKTIMSRDGSAAKQLQPQDICEFLKNVEKSLKDNPKQDPIIIKLPKGEKKKELIREFVSYPEYHRLAAEMVLVYLISIEESFIKEIIKPILFFRKELLMSRDKNICYEYLCAFNSIEEVIGYMVEEESSRIGTNIDAQAKYFSGRPFLIDVKEFKNWKRLREANYRRHLIVHSQAITDRDYCKSTGYRKTGVHLRTNFDYVDTIANDLIAFIKFFRKQLMMKFKIQKPR